MMTEKKDIATRQDVEKMVQVFYQKVNDDSLLSPVFNEVAAVNWDHHLPLLYDFWDSLLLGQATYAGNPLRKHIPLPIDGTHFTRWLALFTQTVDELFAGEKAEEAKLRASHIANVFQFRLEHIHASFPPST